MSLVVLEQVNLSFGAQRVLEDAGLRIDDGERIGLVGPNGAGKSTLLRLITRQIVPDSGEVRFSRAARIGYLSQDVQELPGDTVIAAVRDAVPGRTEIEAALDRAEARLMETTDPDEQMALAQQLADLGERLGHFETFYSEHQAVRILLGLGFGQDELERPVDELSGGWRMRVALAGLLFQQPDVLLMDEPTNHLDLPSVMWLDGFLRELRGALVLICHDRDFLNRHIERVVSLEPEGLRNYTGNYDSYLEQRAQEEEILLAREKNRDRELRDLTKFVERFKSKATKARQAQSRARRVKRLQEEMAADRRPMVRRSLSFRFPEVPRTGRDVVRIEGLSKAFGAKRLYERLTAGIYSGDRIAIVGKNGAGKTTLLRMLAGELKPDAGEIRLGSGVEMGYYAQHHSDLLHEADTAIDAVRRVSPAAGESFVRGVLGAFLFSGDEVDKAIGVLSGGERARVLLARLLVHPGNLLLMDEPTNHLDVAAAEALASALDSYSGTLVFVSHNTAFCNRLATRIWDVEGGELHDYPGTLAEYLDRKERLASEPASAPEPPAAEARPPKPSAPPKKPEPVAKPVAVSPAPEPRARTVRRRKKAGSDQATQASRPGKGSAGKGSAGKGSAGKGSAGRGKPDVRDNTAERSERAPVPAGTKPEAESRKAPRKRPMNPARRARTEERVAELQERAASLEADLADPSFYSDQSRFQTALREFTEVSEKLEELRSRLA